MMPINRLTEFFATAAPASVQPAEGEPHFAVVSFSIAKAKPDWWPSHLEDAPAKLEYEDVQYLGRHTTLPGALAELHAFNGRQTQWPPVEWATIAFVEMGPRDVLEHFARTITPFRYVVLDLRPPKSWQPESVIDAPPGPWSDELSCASLPRCRSLECVVQRVAQRNRRYHERKDKTGFGRKWRIAVAVEHDPLTSSTTLDGNRYTGTLSAHSAARFHLVTVHWPGVVEALNGGGR